MVPCVDFCLIVCYVNFGIHFGVVFGSCSAPHFDVFVDGLPKALGMHLGTIFDLLGLVLGGCRTQKH